MLSEKRMEVLRECWRQSAGKAWEPKGGTKTPLIVAFIEAGYLRTVDGRCGFERFKDSMVTWTEAGKAAMSANPAPQTNMDRSEKDFHRAASALLNTLWQKTYSGSRSHEENWLEMDREFPQARWLHDELKAAKDRTTPPQTNVHQMKKGGSSAFEDHLAPAATSEGVSRGRETNVRNTLCEPISRSPQSKSVLGSTDGPVPLAPCSEAIGESVIKVGAAKGCEIIECGLTTFDEDFCPSLIAERGGIAFHSGLRTEARAQASPSRRKVGDDSYVEHLAEKETPASPETNVYKRGRPAAGVSWPSNNTREMTACEDASIANMPAVDHSSADENILHNAHSEQPTPQTNMREV